MKIHTIIYYFAAILGVTACGSKTQKMQMPEPHINVAMAYEKNLPTRMQFVGETHSLYDVTIQPRVSGYLLSIHYDEGMPITKGQLLYKLDPDQMLVELAKAEATLASAQSQLIEVKNNYSRSVPLARIKAISQSALDQATAKLASARASLNSAKASMKSANLNLSYTTIHAPTDGIIGETIGSVGDYVGVGTSNPILNTISNIDSISVQISIPTAKYLSIMERDNLDKPLYNNMGLLSDVDMILANGRLFPHKGEYYFTERAVNNQTGSIVLHVLFPNPKGYLKPNEYVRINANVGSDIGSIMIPQRAVMQSQGLNSIFIVDKDSTVEYRVVTLGDTNGSEWSILDGVEVGEMVLTEGLQKVHSKMKIVPILKLNRIKAHARRLGTTKEESKSNHN